VLCVDPDETARERTVATLDGDPLTATGVPDADAARSVCAEENVDCVVTEHDLPATDALDLHASLDGVATVVYTDAGDEALAADAMAAGVDRYVPKEDEDLLRDRVLDALDGDATTVAADTTDGHPFAVVEWDREGRIVGWNDRATELFGYERDRVVGVDGTDVLFGGGRRHTGFEAALEGDTTRLVERAVATDGEALTCEWHTAPRTVEGRIAGAVSYVREVGDGARRIEALEALKKTTRRLLRAETPEAVGQATLDAVENVLHKPIAVVRLYDEDSGTLEMVAATDDARDVFDGFPLIGPSDGIIWDAYAAGERRTFESAPVEETVHGQSLPIEDAVIQPIGDYGIISFGHTASGTVDATDLHLTRVLATTAEAALDRTAVRTQLRARKEKIENLHEVVHELETCESETEVWELAVDAAERILEFDECGADEVVKDHLASRATSSELLPEGYIERTAVTDGIAGKTHLEGRTFRIDDVTEDNDAIPESDRYRSLLSVPIGDRGVFQAVSEDVAAFDAADTELAELLLAHVRDALDRLSAETELREERDRFAALFENVPDPVVFATHENDRPIVQAINGAFEETFGLPESTVRGEDLDEFVVPPAYREEGREIERTVVEDGVVVEREVTRTTADGLREFQLTVVPVDLGEQNRRTFGIYTDITERKQRQQRVEVLNRVLRHDLRNGMNIIKGAAETLTGSIDPDERRDLGDTITERANDLLETAEKTRAVERALDRDPGRVDPTDAVSVTDRVCEAIRSEYPAATVSVTGPDSLHVTAGSMLETALYHVVENACVHNDRDPEVDVSIETDGDGAVIRVADNGPGIPDTERALVTEKREITQLDHASGLGLWLVNWVVTRAGGSLTFSDREPRGTVVTLRLPAATEQAAT